MLIFGGEGTELSHSIVLTLSTVDIAVLAFKFIKLEKQKELPFSVLSNSAILAASANFFKSDFKQSLLPFTKAFANSNFIESTSIIDVSFNSDKHSILSLFFNVFFEKSSVEVDIKNGLKSKYLAVNELIEFIEFEV